MVNGVYSEMGFGVGMHNSINTSFSSVNTIDQQFPCLLVYIQTLAFQDSTPQHAHLLFHHFTPLLHWPYFSTKIGKLGSLSYALPFPDCMVCKKIPYLLLLQFYLSLDDLISGIKHLFSWSLPCFLQLTQSVYHLIFSNIFWPSIFYHFLIKLPIIAQCFLKCRQCHSY